MKNNSFDFFEDNSFDSAFQKYGVWPQTVWPIDAQKDVELKKRIGDISVSREKSVGKVYKVGKWRNGNAGSIFSPIITMNILNLFAPSVGWVFDPFGGGGTRAILTNAKGLNYIGIELRKEQVITTRKIIEDGIVNDNLTCEIIEGDSCNSFNIINKKFQKFNFLMTCPPYYDLEKYGGGEKDLSMLHSYHDFLKGIEKVIQETFQLLKPGSLSVWVVGIHRHGAELIHIPQDINNLHKKAGFTHKEEIIAYRYNDMSILRVGNFEKGNNYLIRNHEYIEVYVRP